MESKVLAMTETTKKSSSNTVSLFCFAVVVFVWSVYFYLPDSSPTHQAGGNTPIKYNSEEMGVFYNYKQVTLKQISEVVNMGEKLSPNHPSCFDRKEHGVLITLNHLSKSRSMEISLGSKDVYSVVFLNNGIILDASENISKYVPGGGLFAHKVKIHRRVFTKGFDQVAVKGSGGDGSYCVGHLLLN
jgi:hypothetical protein